MSTQEGVTAQSPGFGDRVIALDYSGQPLVRRVLYRTKTAVFVSSEESFEPIVAGAMPMPMVGFPVRDVLVYDSELYETRLIQWKTEHYLGITRDKTRVPASTG